MSSEALRPAILGGKPAVTCDQTEALRWPIITEEDEQAVLEVLRSGMISVNPVSRELEHDYKEYFGAKHALSHCNGTAALLAGFFAFDLSPGDEVIVPSATFWASVLPMLWLGAIPVFCESETDRLGLDPEDLERKITSRTKAIVVVHLWGMPSLMSEINRIAKKHGLLILEDASHAHGAAWRGKPCGTLGDIGVFSLQGDKLSPAGEGGILLTDNDEYFERAVILGDMVRTMGLTGPAQRFAGTTFGVKTRIAPLSAAVARVQLRHLDSRNERRNKNLTRLSKRLERLGIHTFLPPEHVKRVYFEYLVRYSGALGISMESLVAALTAEGCQVSAPRYPLVHQQPFFTEGHFAKIARLQGDSASSLPVYEPNALPKTEAANKELLKLPAFPNAGEELIDSYAVAFEKVFAHADEIEHLVSSKTPSTAGCE